MNITAIIRRTGFLFILGLSIGACGASDPGSEPFGLSGDDSSTSDDPSNSSAGMPGDADADADGDGGDSSDGGDDDGSDGEVPASCGNGMFDPGEQCDDSDANEVDGCLSDCRFGPLDIAIDDTNPNVLEQRGNLGGGSAHDDACPEGEVITGIVGRSGLFAINAVRFECGVVGLADPEDPEVLHLGITPGTKLPSRGGIIGGFGFSAHCPDDHAVVGFGGRSGSQMEQIVLSCARVVIVDDGTSLSVGMEEPFDLEPVGSNDDGGAFPDGACGAGEVATVGNTRSGALLDAFGMTCMPLNLVF